MLDFIFMAGVTGGITSLDRRIPFLLSQLGFYVASEFQSQMSGSGMQPPLTCWRARA
ncbi:MAG: hypothetical protein QOK02_3457 [Mycobacterium sp.]|jgi:hypothetical protein|nr:hypothetical protein [Mycobacterium sp.]